MAGLEARKATIAEAAAAASSEGGLPPGLKLEDASVLQIPGASDGQTKIVREGNAGVAYSWDAAR